MATNMHSDESLSRKLLQHGHWVDSKCPGFLSDKRAVIPNVGAPGRGLPLGNAFVVRDSTNRLIFLELRNLRATGARVEDSFKTLIARLLGKNDRNERQGIAFRLCKEANLPRI
jgi:hypothetical protein